MSKEAEIVRKCVSHVPKIKEIEGGHVSEVCQSYKKSLLKLLSFFPS